MRKRCLLALSLLAILWITGQTPAVLPADNPAEIPAEPYYVALTFDDGPKRGTTDLLLDGLKERGASATFFLVGEQAVLHPDLVKRMIEEGHQVGNHTWSHVRLEGQEEAVGWQEIEKMELWLENTLGGSGYWLRPPYGLIDKRMGANVTVPMIKWSIDPRDWESRNSETIYRAVLEEVRPDSIILLHDIYEPSVEAALRLVDRLQASGYLFVTVEELLALNRIEPKAGVLYRTGNGI